MSSRLDPIVIKLTERPSDRLTVVRDMEIHEVDGTEVEVSMFANDAAIEFRVAGDVPRIFQVSLRQIIEQALDRIGDELERVPS